MQSYKGCQSQNMAGVSPEDCRRLQQKSRKSSCQSQTVDTVKNLVSVEGAVPSLGGSVPHSGGT